MENLRRKMIISYLKRKKTCTLKELMEEFNVSSATIHRDVTLLASRDAIERVRGGLVYNDAPDANGSPAAFQERVVANRRLKMTAAGKALALIEEGDIIFLDSSTTIYELALLLTHAEFDHLTVITNAVAVMNLFRKFPPHWSPQLNSILGDSALEQLSRLNITKSFVSGFGLDDSTATTNHERQAEILRKVLDAADRRYLIIDHTKIGRKGLYRIAARGGFDAIISD